MARRSFDVFDLIELFTHWHAGRSQRQLAESLGIDRKTIAKYLAPAIAESLTPGGGADHRDGVGGPHWPAVSRARRSRSAGHDLAGHRSPPGTDPWLAQSRGECGDGGAATA
jgi:hypothetical protein